MTSNDLKEKISKSASFEWFNNIEETFNFPHLNYTQTFKGIVAIYEFIRTQYNEWNNLESYISDSFDRSKNYFFNIKSSIEGFIGNYIDYDISYLNSIWQSNVRNLINNQSRTVFIFNSPETIFLIGIKKQFPDYFEGAYAYIINDISSNLHDRNYFTGVMMGYEYKLKDTSQILDRRKIERLSINKIRTEFETYLSKSEIELANYFKRFKDEYEKHVLDFENIKMDKSNAFEDWFNNSQSKYSEFYNNAQLTSGELENTYEELLRLKKPAEYWNLRSKELKRQGWVSLGILIGLVTIGCIMLFSLLWITPDAMLKSFFGDDKSSAVRWSIVFITLISFFVFGIRALTRVTFSSFHLARDAEERERLTFVYLAMIKDSSMEKEDRHLIMQSLFSRADTGLLKEDSAPTMPGAGGFIGNLVK